MSRVCRRAAVCGVLLALASAVPVSAQVSTGEIFGKVTDGTGAVLPGVTVTITSPALIQPQSVAPPAAAATGFRKSRSAPTR